MIDFALEQQIKDVKELLEGWNVFREYYKIGENKEKPTREQEDAFLECKKHIAMLHDEFMETIPAADSPVNRKKQKDGKSVIKHVIQCVTIKHIHTFYSNQHKEFEKDWNDAYMLLTETIEKLENKKAEIANVSYTQLAASDMKKKIMKRVKDFVTGPFVRYGSILAVLIIIPSAIQLTGLYDLQQIPSDIPSVARAYYPLERAFRKILNPSLKYTSLAYAERYQGELPPGYSKPTPQPGTTKEQALQLMVFSNYETTLDLQPELEPTLEFSHEYYLVDGETRLDMIIFRLPTNAEAEAAVVKYQHWVGALKSEDRAKQEADSVVFRANNIFVMITSTSTSARTYFQKQQWGVRN